MNDPLLMKRIMHYISYMLYQCHRCPRLKPPTPIDSKQIAPLGSMDQQAKLLEELNELNQQIRMERQRRRRRRKSAIRWPRALLDMLLTLLVLEGTDTQCAYMYLAEVKKKNKQQLIRDHPLQELQRMVLEQYAQAALPRLCTLDDAAQQGTTPLGRRALRYFRDFELAHWVRGLNAEAGVAVSSSKVVFQRAEQQRCAVGDASWKTANGHSLGITNRQKCYIRRWRKRYSVKYKVMPVREDLAVEVLQDKVPKGGGFCRPGAREKRGAGPKKT